MGGRPLFDYGRKNIPWQGVRATAMPQDGHEFLIEISFGEYISVAKIFTAVVRDITEASLPKKRQKIREYRHLFNTERRRDRHLRTGKRDRAGRQRLACKMYGYAREEFLGRSLGKCPQTPNAASSTSPDC